MVANINVVVWRLWEWRVLKNNSLEKLISVLSQGIFVISEGGNCSSWDLETWKDLKTTRDDMLQIITGLVMENSKLICICLSTQLLSSALNDLTFKMIDEIKNFDRIKETLYSKFLSRLGNMIEIYKDGKMVCNSTRDSKFSVYLNEEPENRWCKLYKFSVDDCELHHLPEQVIFSHNLVSKKFKIS